MATNLENPAVATGLENVSFHSSTKEHSNYCTIVLISHASKVTLKILQARLQQYVNQELPHAQAGFRKGRGKRNQVANIHWIMGKAREFQEKAFTSASLMTRKPLTVWITKKKKLENSQRDGNTGPPYLSPEKPVCGSRSNS